MDDSGVNDAEAAALAAEWNHLIKERMPSFGAAGTQPPFLEKVGSSNSADSEWHHEDEDEDEDEEGGSENEGGPPHVTPSKTREAEDNVSREGARPAYNGLDAIQKKNALIQKFGAREVESALSVLENSINGSPSKIPVIALGDGNKDTHEMMLRMQEDKLMADIEIILGVDGLSYLSEFMELLQ